MNDQVKQCFDTRYFSSDITKREALKVTKTYQGLRLVDDTYVFSNGMSKYLVKLKGTIPVPYKGRTYNIPISIWLMDTHPLHAPVCMVEPTQGMRLNPSKHLDNSGRVYLPYLHNWNQKSSTVVELIQVMIQTFGEAPPVYSVSSKTEPFANPIYPPQAVTNRLAGSGMNPITPLYPAFAGVPTFSSYTSPPTSTPSVNFQYPGYPPYPTPATSTAGAYPPFPPSSTASPPYPIQPTTTGVMPGYSTPVASVASSVTSPSNTGTITDEHIRASLMSAIEDKIRRKINEQTAQCQDEMEILLQTQRELNQGKNKLDSMLDKLEKEKESIKQKIEILKNKEEELEKNIEKLSTEEEVDVDEAVVTTTPLYKQILNLHCEDAATEDTIYYIGEALRRGVIDLDIFIKQIRTLSRKRLLLKALLEKCRVRAGLQV